MKGFVLLCITLLLLPGAAFSQDDDLLAPLVPSDKKKPAQPLKRKKPKPARGTLLVTAVGPRSATVLLNNTETVTLPSGPIELDAGTHNILVKRRGYSDFARTISVRAGQQTEVVAVMEATGGVLNVDTHPDGATVTVDGQAVGTTPLRDVVFPAGTYELKLSRSGYYDEVARMSIRLGKEQSLNLWLKPMTTEDVFGSPLVSEVPFRAEGSGAVSALQGLGTTKTVEAPQPWYGRWYVWAGVGAVAVATVVTLIVVKAPAESPEKVCRAECDGVVRGVVPQTTSNALFRFP